MVRALESLEIMVINLLMDFLVVVVLILDLDLDFLKVKIMASPFAAAIDFKVDINITPVVMGDLTAEDFELQDPFQVAQPFALYYQIYFPH